MDILKDKDIVSCRLEEDNDTIDSDQETPHKKAMQNRYVLEVKTNALELRVKLDRLKSASQGELNASLVFEAGGKIQ